MEAAVLLAGPITAFFSGERGFVDVVGTVFGVIDVGVAVDVAVGVAVEVLFDVVVETPGQKFN